MDHLFGPVLSRRLGLSLGVDLVPCKVCSMDCIYCEAGRTTKKTLKRAEYVKLQDVKKELETFLSQNPGVDYVTFSGCGEPTLFSRLGELVRFLKENFPCRLALITNSSLLAEILEELKGIDVVLPSLDAVTEEVFVKINRPAKGLSAKKIIEGIRKLISAGIAEVWIETLFVKGINDSREEVLRIGDIVHSLNPSRWQINTVVRPPACNVEGLSREELEEIAGIVSYPRTDILLSGPSGKVPGKAEDTENALYKLVLRRPCPVEEIASALGITKDEAEKLVEKLEKEGKVERVWFGERLYVKGR